MKFSAVLASVTMLFAATPAAAVCTAANQYGFAFASQAAASLSYGSTYNYTASTSGGATQAFTMHLAQNGMTSTVVGGVQLPAISTLISGPDNTKRDLVIGGTFSARTTDIASGTRTASVTFTFSTPVRDFAMVVHDIDFGSNQYRDWLMITGTGNGVTYTPSLVTPWNTGNASGDSRTNANSSVTVGPSATPITITAAQAVGSGASGNNSDTGTIAASFSQPVTAITVRYGNAPLTGSETGTGQQGMGIQSVSFCPMPQVSVTKTSEPVTGALGAYALPGVDTMYTFTVTNSGGSPVDAGSIVLTDLLPAGITFRNTPLDATTGAPFSLNAGTSGMTLPAGSGAFSNNGGASFGYAPASGYDAAISAIRVAPAGSMAADSSFSVSFVGRIK